MTAPGQFTGNLHVFCRALREQGIAVSAGQVMTALRAVTTVGLERREDVFAALRASLLNDVNDFPVFSEIFNRVFCGTSAPETPTEFPVPGASEAEGLPEPLAVFAPRWVSTETNTPDDDHRVPDDPAGSSTAERLGKKDFEAMDVAERRRAGELVRALRLPVEPRPSRRFVASAAGRHLDLRRSIRGMLRRNAELVSLSRATRRRQPRELVLLCDVSASMSSYSDIFLHFAHALTMSRPGSRTFIFGTRLTDISPYLNMRDVDDALAGLANAARDMDGGTRIAASLRAFNRDWLRRLPMHDRIVILLTDGLERDTESDLEFQVARLHRSCRQLVWLNPMLRYEQFEPKAFGIRTMLPHVDQFLPVHNLDSISALVRSLAAPADDQFRVVR